MNAVIQAAGLVKKYGDVIALDGLDLTVPEGKVLGLLGPNGAGKTTAVSILTTLLEPDSGRASVAGFDVCWNPEQVRKHIGLSWQYAATARRNDTDYPALFNSTYVREDGSWRLGVHQQTPI